MDLKEKCPPLDKINGPAGDCMTITSYQEYVCRMLRDELTLDEIGEIRRHYNCAIGELVDRIIETKLSGHPLAARRQRNKRGAANGKRAHRSACVRGRGYATLPNLSGPSGVSLGEQDLDER